MLNQLSLYDLPEQCEVAPNSQTHPPFVLISTQETVVGYGQLNILPVDTIASLSNRVSDFFENTNDGPDLLVGAVPFNRENPTHLLQPQRVLRVQGRFDLRDILGLTRQSDSTWSPGSKCRVVAVPSIPCFSKIISTSLDEIQKNNHELIKVVLSRSLVIENEQEFNLQDLMQELAIDQSVTVFSLPLPSNGPHARSLIGATPELLVAKRGRCVCSHPLAGSAKRSKDPIEDDRRAKALLVSKKDQQEHRIVVECIMDSLTPYCSQLSPSEGTVLSATSSMWHLGTRIIGKLKDSNICVTKLVEILHPTPAVCGLPRNAANALINELETYDRGFYAGAVGWCNAAGDGRWHVAIRCAEISGNTARLYAGAGIVPGSTPQGEIDETSAKFSALLHALNIDETGEPGGKR